MAQMRQVLEEHADEVVSQTAESGLCTVFMNLNRDLLEVRFLKANVAREYDRETLAEEVLGTIKAAQVTIEERIMELLGVS
ncbi:YbaB/EbfC family nucleoid-associated protein [Glycomyces luteolus]|uniref:YbaB/EbfC family nucleoid-associated protein n=1 Tax=Glycomyces luteolus TaxID=2670330 RepID=A0A9X3PGH1_9ACTN|nr:YbaB/EbfC family nucleoid-associated protein [Glycomyces luteolus]MDA1363038.1 YbaB/EbfC family nucleoid-associated protein [Glycomyces luteolus]